MRGDLTALQNRSLRTATYMDAWEGPIQFYTRLREFLWSHSPLIYGVLELKLVM